MTFNNPIDLVPTVKLKDKKRFVFIDGLRGIAALWVVSFHFYAGSPLKEPLSKILPEALCWFFQNGDLGVEVFFVISGFVIAYSTRNIKINFNYSKYFFSRRFLRLAPPYWVAIALTIIADFASNFVLKDRTASIPGFQAITAHIFYLQDIVQINQILPVFWTLCLEVQFYLVFISLLFMTQLCHQKSNWSDRTVLLLIFTPLLCLSIITNVISYSYLIPGLFVSYWYMFYWGILIFWFADNKSSSLHFYSNFLLLIILAIFKKDLEVGIVLSLGSIILFSMQKNYIYSWLNNYYIQYIAKISYSLYLIHIITGTRLINLGYRISSDPLFSLFLFGFAFAISIISAHCLYYLVEQPSIHLGKQIKILPGK